MSVIIYFPVLVSQSISLPQGFPSPFSNTPHPVAQHAALDLQQRLSRAQLCQHDFDAPGNGKMFGVLVVRDASGQLGYLAAFSGMIGGTWKVPGFVPPVFDSQVLDAFLPAGNAQLKAYADQLSALQNSAVLGELLVELEQLAQQREVALAALKEVHQRRKRARRQQRQQLGSTAADDAILVKLSFESQQDKRELRALQTDWCERLAVVEAQSAPTLQQISELKRTRTRLSNKLHRRVFKAYILVNRFGEHKVIADLFERGLPPGGSGDCAAPKLLQYAHQQGLMPLALAEFWWGAPPQAGVRHHGHYYPACRGKCHPILPFMLKGIEVQPRRIAGHDFNDSGAPEVVYEDDELLVVNKPSGLLSVPGKETTDSVQTRLQHRYPTATGLLLVHRLDMSTSGLLLVAKNRSAHKALQRQFLQRTIEKRYVAVLSKRLPVLSAHDAATGGAGTIEQGIIELPLWVDIDDRPRQLVCFIHGKPSVTRWQVIARTKATTRVYFYPHTGRTHQLRLHAAHPKGLNAPILGDELYGEPVERLLLHAEKLSFDHPVTKRRIDITVPAPF